MPQSSPRWPMFQAVHARAQLLDDMLRATRINPRVAVRACNGAAIIEARATCIACPYSRDCRSWLDEPPANAVPTGPDDPPDFCPNRDFLSQCKAAQVPPTPAIPAA